MQRLTQNQNETIILLSKCPKTKFCGKVKVLLAVSGTVSHFNTGSGSKVTLWTVWTLTHQKINMLSAVQKVDYKHIVAAKKIQKNLECIGESYVLKN